MASNADHTAFCQRWNKIIDTNKLCLLQDYTDVWAGPGTCFQPSLLWQRWQDVHDYVHVIMSHDIIMPCKETLPCWFWWSKLHEEDMWQEASVALTQSLHEMGALSPTTENNHVSLEADSSSAKLQMRPEPWPMPYSSRVRPWIEDWAKLIYRNCEITSVCCFKLLGLW